jgi:hypothetical protein
VALSKKRALDLGAAIGMPFIGWLFGSALLMFGSQSALELSGHVIPAMQAAELRRIDRRLEAIETELNEPVPPDEPPRVVARRYERKTELAREKNRFLRVREHLESRKPLPEWFAERLTRAILYGPGVLIAAVLIWGRLRPHRSDGTAVRTIAETPRS